MNIFQKYISQNIEYPFYINITTQKKYYSN